MDIFESLEELNVSEECFEDIMGLVEEILGEEDVYEPAAYTKDGYNFMATGNNKLNGKLYRVHTKHDKGVTKTKLYAKDGDSARKLVQKAYGGPDSSHTLANESLYNEIMGLVEELILERNKENRVKKKNWEFNKIPDNELSDYSKEGLAHVNQDTIKKLKQYVKVDPHEKDAYFKQREIDRTVDSIAANNRNLLGRKVPFSNYQYEQQKRERKNN